MRIEFAVCFLLMMSVLMIISSNRSPPLLAVTIPVQKQAEETLPTYQQLTTLISTNTTPSFQGCPVIGRVVITQPYGPTHSGLPRETFGAVDLAVDGDGNGYADPAGSWGAPIVAMESGTVRVSLNAGMAGNHVWLDGDSGLRWGHAHLETITVVSGQRVEAGEQIGTMGSTGMSTGPHLDLQLWDAGANVDPTPYLSGCW